MDTGNFGKKAAIDDQYEPSSKRWLRSDAKKSGYSGGMNSDGSENKFKIDKDDKSATNAKSRKSKRAEKRKLTKMDVGSEKPSKCDETVAKGHGGKTITDLPGELLTKIIDMVPIQQRASLGLVNHEFQEIIHGMWDQLRQLRLDEFLDNKRKKVADLCQVGEAILKKFLLRAPYVTSISGFHVFYNYHNTIPLATIQVLSQFKHLDSINFSGGQVITTSNFIVFLESAASRQCWKYLNLHGGIREERTMDSNDDSGSKENRPVGNLECFEFNVFTLRTFYRFFPNDWSRLKKLVILHSDMVSPKWLLSIIRGCTQLAHLQFSIPKCGNGNGEPSYIEFMQGVAALENLSVLSISRIYRRIPDDWWQDDPIRAALLVLIQDLGRPDRRSSITEMTLRIHCNDEIIGAIIDRLPHLKLLNLNHVENCTKSSLVRLANKLGKLESLSLEMCRGSVDGNVIRAIAGNMSGLQRLYLDHPSINSEDLNSLADLRNLKELRLSRLCTRVFVDTWARLGFGSRLETLELISNRGISPKGIGGFLKNMPRLRRMQLMGINDKILAAIAKSCPQLLELTFWNSPKITPAVVQSVINHCSELKLLGFRDHQEWFPSALRVGEDRKITFESAW